MDTESVRKFCLKLPHVTEDVKWGGDLCFLIAQKMFAVASLEPDDHWLSFKCTPEKFAELLERPGIMPAPYMARNHWVSLRDQPAMRDTELQEHLRTAYELVKAKLPKKVQAALAEPATPKRKTTRKRPR
jgi:predicted DNA-binding protein (MmcQ/YjbR family)